MKKRRHQKSQVMRGLKLPLCMSFAVLLFLTISAYEIRGELQEKQEFLVVDAVRRGVVQCYAIEGRYPPDIAYLEARYGLSVDQDKYIVHYEVFASNIYPDITVIEKKWRSVDE